MQSKHKQNVNIADETLQITAFSVGITIINQRIIWKDYIEFVTEFLCLLGHPVPNCCRTLVNLICIYSTNGRAVEIKLTISSNY